MTRDSSVTSSWLRKAAFTLLLGALSFSGCKQGKEPSKRPHRPPPAVSYVTLKPRKVTLKEVLPGRTAPFRIAEIRPQVSGLILKRAFREGSNVRAGQLLYQIDPAPFRAALDNARANLAKAEADLPAIAARVARYKELLGTKAVSQQDYDDVVASLKQARAAIQQAKAAVATARINLRYTRITAPISGRIGISNVTEGAIVTAYQPTPLATIQQLDPIYVDTPQSTAELLRLKHALARGGEPSAKQHGIGLILEDGSPYPLKGTFKFQDVSVNPTTGSVILRMVFPNPESVLLPNMFVQAVIPEGTREHALLVPQQAVSRTPKGLPYVLIVTAQKRVALRMLTIERAIGTNWLVSSGLKFGDRVIVSGLQYIRPGMPVRAAPFTGHPGSPNTLPHAPKNRNTPSRKGA